MSWGLGIMNRFNGLNMQDLVLGQFADARKYKIEDLHINLVDLTYSNLVDYTCRYIMNNCLHRGLPPEIGKRHSFHIKYDKLYDSIYKGEYDKVCNDMFDNIIKYATEFKDRRLVGFSMSCAYKEEYNDLEAILDFDWSKPIETDD